MVTRITHRDPGVQIATNVSDWSWHVRTGNDMDDVELGNATCRDRHHDSSAVLC